MISSLKQIGNIVLICCAFFIIFGILGVQLFKGKFYYCEGENLREVRTKLDCEEKGYVWKNRRYNFDHLGQALMSLFVLSSKGIDLQTIWFCRLGPICYRTYSIGERHRWGEDKNHWKRWLGRDHVQWYWCIWHWQATSSKSQSLDVVVFHWRKFPITVTKLIIWILLAIKVSSIFIT